MQRPNIYVALGRRIGSGNKAHATTRVTASIETYDDADSDSTSAHLSSTFTKVEGETYDDSDIALMHDTTLLSRVEGETYDDSGSFE